MFMHIRFCGNVVVATYLGPLRYWILFQEPSIVEKIMEIDEYIGCAMSRLTTDAVVETQSRPFGISPLIAGHDENGPSL
ncbi:hypothetical protein J1N35_031308 [Gossypium stocksii]|uniref:Uncharacterized protein n=1 Tax=Gossypium stocksii TaxID=47602 RepID=A0A9D3ZTM0_9ROSI|nr:hypothetical protein J1N35_031308 [Gossypium stocksii]